MQGFDLVLDEGDDPLGFARAIEPKDVLGKRHILPPARPVRPSDFKEISLTSRQVNRGEQANPVTRREARVRPYADDDIEGLEALRGGAAASVTRGDQGVTVRVALTVTPLRAEIVTDRVEVTAVVVIVNIAVVWPGATVTEAGTCAVAVRLLLRVTTVPPAGAGPVNVTVPVDGFPPRTLLGLRIRDEATGAVTVKVAVRVVPRYVAEIVSVLLEVTGLVVAAKVAAVAPAGTVTVAGTWAAAVLLDVSVTTAPPAGAGPLSVTVPVEGFLPRPKSGSV
ncbi:MAG: hypothetical protein MZU79_07120 [Anaerotruncus sp.]|nr:hypothetical protein [Anaerotruncus sp.]